jgi:hypothetical protein
LDVLIRIRSTSRSVTSSCAVTGEDETVLMPSFLPARGRMRVRLGVRLGGH